jgi:hypothetical protein
MPRRQDSRSKTAWEPKKPSLFRGDPAFGYRNLRFPFTFIILSISARLKISGFLMSAHSIVHQHLDNIIDGQNLKEPREIWGFYVGNWQKA